MSINRRIELLNWAGRKPERYVIEDDYDGEFKFREKPTPALKSMDTNDDVIYLGSLSRLVAPSLRVSYMILPERLMKKYEAAFKGFGCPVSLFIQAALSRFMLEGYFEKHINRMKALYNRKYSKMKSLRHALRNLGLYAERWAARLRVDAAGGGNRLRGAV